MACPGLCASCCYYCYKKLGCCDCLRLKVAKKYSSVAPEQASEIVEVPDTSFHNVPLQKIFDFPQPGYEDVGTHPQVSQCSTPIIKEQPYGSELYPEPIFVTKKGRSHTFSQLPEDQGYEETTDSRSDNDSPERPFTPPDEVPSKSRQAIIVTPDIPLDTDDPAIQFSLYYDIQRRTLSIHLHQALNLPLLKRDVRYSHDPFIVIFLLPTREVIHQTVTIANSRDPKYKQIFEFCGILAEEVHQQVVVFQVFYNDKFSRDHLIGSVLMPLKEADLYGVVMTKRIGDGQELLKVICSSFSVFVNVGYACLFTCSCT